MGDLEDAGLAVSRVGGSSLRPRAHSFAPPRSYMGDMTDWRASAYLDAARAGDRDAFGALAEIHRRELLLHSYRLLGSLDAAEDVVQETLLRAWQHLDRFQGNRLFRAWLYKIATNASLDVLASRPHPALRRHLTEPDATELTWLQPFPDAQLPSTAASPETHFLARESITLAFVVLLQALPPRQRAILVLRDVLDWSAREVAALLETSVPSVESALHRARVTLSRYQVLAEVQPSLVEGSTRALLEQYVQAWEHEDIDTLTRLLHADAHLNMPPRPDTYHGPAAIVAFWHELRRDEARQSWRLLPTRANTQPAFAFYHRAPGATTFDAHGILVLHVADEHIDRLTMFLEPGLFAHFQLPASLPR